MTLPLVVLRPEPGCAETLAAAHKLGLVAFASPLFAVEPVEWEAPDPAGLDGILAGSANAFRHCGAAIQPLMGLPVHAVGSRTAKAARVAGFEVAAIGEGGLQSLLAQVRRPATLLRLSGEARVPLVPPAGVTLIERVVYRAVPHRLTEEAAGVLRQGAIALLHSGEAAHAFADECTRLAIERARIAIAAMAPRIAEAAGSGWRSVETSPAATDAALLAMTKHMCH